MTAKNTFTAGTDILASTMNENFATVPWAMEVSTSTVTGTGSVNLTANRFNATFAPRVIATVISTAGTASSVTVGTPTYNSGTGVYNVPLYVWSGSTASTVARVVQVAAFQMLSGAANG